MSKFGDIQLSLLDFGDTMLDFGHPTWILDGSGRDLARTDGFQSTGRDPVVMCRIPAMREI
jgi:hypothetical protein